MSDYIVLTSIVEGQEGALLLRKDRVISVSKKGDKTVVTTKDTVWSVSESVFEVYESLVSGATV